MLTISTFQAYQAKISIVKEPSNPRSRVQVSLLHTSFLAFHLTSSSWVGLVSIKAQVKDVRLISFAARYYFFCCCSTNSKR